MKLSGKHQTSWPQANGAGKDSAQPEIPLQWNNSQDSAMGKIHNRMSIAAQYVILVFTAMLLGACSETETATPDYWLWYEQPAAQWEETLPLGNGRIGIMPDGQVAEETLV